MENNLLILGRGDSLQKGFDFFKGVIWCLNDLPEKCDRRINWDGGVEGAEKLKVWGGKWENEGNWLNKEKGKVANFNTSLCFALNIAYHEGFYRIYLLGFDNRPSKNDRSDYRNLFTMMQKYCKKFERDMPNVYLIDSAIEAFNHITHSEFRTLFVSK